MKKVAAGFTLVELLVVIAVLACLLATAGFGLSGTSERGHRIVCLNNLRQMGRGSQMYSQEDSQGRLTGTLKPDNNGYDGGIAGGNAQQADDDANWLHGFGSNFAPGYIPDLNTFICPSTRNSINPNKKTIINPQGSLILITELTDLMDNAASNTSTNGYSYEVFGCWSAANFFYPRKTARAVLTYAHHNAPLLGAIAGPSQTMVMVDGMEPHPSSGLPFENYPNPLDCHGRDGANAVFADSHAEWIGTADWNYRYELSQDAGRQLTPYSQ